jgi:hypothetical protein
MHSIGWVEGEIVHIRLTMGKPYECRTYYLSSHESPSDLMQAPFITQQQKPWHVARPKSYAFALKDLTLPYYLPLLQGCSV